MTIHRIYDADAEVQPVASQLWSVKNCFGEKTFQELSTTHLNHVDAVVFAQLQHQMTSNPMHFLH
jgi:hypothetical protein